MNVLEMGFSSYGAPTVHGQESQVRIGKYTSIANSATFDAGMQHQHRSVSTYPFWILGAEKNGYTQTRGPIVVGSDVWIGDGALIMSGLEIGDGAVIGARAVVTRSVPPYAIVGGVPARVIGYRFEPKIVEALLKIKWWDWPMEKVKENAQALMSYDLKGFIEKHSKE